MKKVLLLAAAATVASSLFAAAPVDPKLQQYAKKAMPACSGSVVTLEPSPVAAPQGFVPFRLTQKSTDSTCGRSTGLLYSPTSGQVIVTDMFQIPMDLRPLDARLADMTSQILNVPTKATIETGTLPDGLWKANISKETPYGPFFYHGYVDGSRRFFLVGRRGNIAIDPGKSLVEAIGLQNAVVRGAKNAKVQIIELSDFECPTCRRAHQQLEPFFKKNLDRISYARIDLPLFEHHQWSVYAAMGARAIQQVAPQKYWAYVDYMFENQENIKRENVDTFVKDFCEDNDISWKKVEPLYRSTADRKKLFDQISRAFDNGVNGTPTFIVNGQFVNYGADGAFLKQYLDTVLPARK